MLEPVTPGTIVRVGVLGAGAWARAAHLPGYRRDPRCRVIAIADPEIDRAQRATVPQVVAKYKRATTTAGLHPRSPQPLSTPQGLRV